MVTRLFDQLRVTIVYVLPTCRKAVLIKIMVFVVDSVAVRHLSTKITNALH